MAKFRFQDMEIWQMALDVADPLLDIADRLERRQMYGFAKQLRGAAMSISNNIAEGSDSSSARDFAHFLNIARRSSFENANILFLLPRRGLVGEDERDRLLEQLDHLCRKITNFQRSLRRA